MIGTIIVVSREKLSIFFAGTKVQDSQFLFFLIYFVKAFYNISLPYVNIKSQAY